MAENQPQVPGAPPPAAVPTAPVAWGDSQPPEALSADERLWGMLANLLGIIWLLGPIVALIAKGSSKFVKFNALQMIFLCLVLIPIGIALGIAFTILAFVPIVGWLIISVVSPVLSLASLCLIVFLGIKANNGVLYRLPIIGDMAYKNAYAG